jgi:hypothetical protein
VLSPMMANREAPMSQDFFRLTLAGKVFLPAVI